MLCARNGSSEAMCASITCPGRANPCCGFLTPCVERFTQPTVVTASIGEPCPLTIPSNSSEWNVDRETRSLGPCHPTGTPEAHFQAHRDGPATEFCARSSLPVNWTWHRMWVVRRVRRRLGTVLTEVPPEPLDQGLPLNGLATGGHPPQVRLRAALNPSLMAAIVVALSAPTSAFTSSSYRS